MEERICIVSKGVYAAMLEAMPPEARALTDRNSMGQPIGGQAIILQSPFGYRLLFTADWGKQ